MYDKIVINAILCMFMRLFKLYQNHLIPIFIDNTHIFIKNRRKYFI